MAEEIRVTDNVDAARFEIFVDGALAGFADYRLRKDKIVITHTEIDESYGGRGLGSKLAKAALDASRDTGLAVAPACPFVADYIRRHPEYLDLVADDYREAVEAGPGS
ncbi:GNAT family N-acetyltransferase [Spongiactinospora sp. TRM90649]|uniref:GNAT family N-acetyltransferase n=1 Tax=Spongiactinospora sp. TRM90649 TaxID=3031114 RepID=UPI0023F8CC55|nr:GNAT family N-acetyltransferase [Spongiactinospora sp. TRM90649]MDF5754751.1 GNAT family N-acetyltransferase [Spongiactinospora sp. TRM90649]